MQLPSHIEKTRNSKPNLNKTGEDKSQYQSNYQWEYRQFFKNEINQLTSFDLKNIPQPVLEHHKIKIIDASDEYLNRIMGDGSFYIQCVQTSLGSLQFCYQVVLGPFYLIIKILNFYKNSPLTETQDVQHLTLGEGTFGIVKMLKIQNTKIAIKHLVYHKNVKGQMDLPELRDPCDFVTPYKLRQAIRQYCIYKICSMLQIGPQVIFNDTYDLICFNDGIEFHMELCQPVKVNVRQTYQGNIKYCVAKFHKINFVHKDLKPSNTLYSPSLKRYVLGDCGIAQYVKEAFGQKTLTFYQGTEGYMSKEMRQLQNTGKPGYVNLYHNDMHSLKITFSNMKKQILKFSSSQSQKSATEGSGYPSHQFSYIQRQDSSKDFSNQSSQKSVSHGTLKNFQQGGIKSSTSYQTLDSKGENKLLPGPELIFYIAKIAHRISKLHLNEDFMIQQILNNEYKAQSVVLDIMRAGFLYMDEQREAIIAKEIKGLLDEIKGGQGKINVLKAIARIHGTISDQYIEAIENMFMDIQGNINIKNIEAFVTDRKRKVQNSFWEKKFQVLMMDIHRHYLTLNLKKLKKDSKVVIKILIRQKEYVKLLSHEDKKILAFALFRIIPQISKLNLTQQLLKIKSVIDLLFQSIPRKQRNSIHAMSQLPEDSGLLERQWREKYQVVKYFHQLLVCKQFYGQGLERQVIVCLSQIKVLQAQKQYVISCFSKLYLRMCNNQLFQYQQDMEESERQVVKYNIVIDYLNLLVSCGQIQKSFEVFNKNKRIYEKMNRFNEKAQFAYLAISVLVENGDYIQADEWNESFFLFSKEYFFPKQSIYFLGKYWVYKTKILQRCGRLKDAMKYYQKIEYLASQSVYQNLEVDIILTNSLMMKVFGGFHEKKGFIEYFIKELKKKRINKKEDVSNRLRTLGSFIKLLIQQNQLENLHQLFKLFLITKMDILYYFDKSQHNISSQIRSVPAFRLQSEEACPQVAKTTLIKVYKALAYSIQAYLPFFLVQYRDCLQKIAFHYINIMRMPTKALPFLWNYFRKYPLLSFVQNRQFFEKVLLFANLLIDSNSNRKAMKFLQKYVFRIGVEYNDLREAFFKKLQRLSLLLGEKRHSFYNAICKYEGYANEQKLSVCLQKISQLNLKEGAKVCMKKKMHLLKIGNNYQSQKIEMSSG